MTRRVKEAKAMTIDARRAKRIMTLLRFISLSAANAPTPSADEWARIVRIAADLEREAEVEQWYVASGRRARTPGRKGAGEAERNAYAQQVAWEMQENGRTFPRACAEVAKRAKAVGLEAGDPRTIEKCCLRAARSSYPEYRQLFGLTIPAR